MNRFQALPLGLIGMAGIIGVSKVSAADTDIASSRALMQSAEQRSSFLTDEPPIITLSGQLQFRYQANFRDDQPTNAGGGTDDDVTVGFVMRRAKIAAKAKVTDTIHANIQLAFNRSTGLAALETAEINWKLTDDWTLRFGQFKSPFLREELVSSKRQLTSERSPVNETFNQDYSQGVELNYAQESWRLAFMVSDGFNTDNTRFNSAMESDIALTARAEVLLGDAGFKQYKQFTSFRGVTQGAMLGLAGHWQSMGDTNPSLPNSMDMTTITGDFSFVADGWNLYAAGIWRNMDVTAATSADDFGVVVQGGVFISDADEIFARYSGFFPDDFDGAADFNSLTVGWNRYISPESHAAKLTVDLTYHFDAVTGSGIATSDGHNLLTDTNDGQLGLIAQVQLLF